MIDKVKFFITAFLLLALSLSVGCGKEPEPIVSGVYRATDISIKETSYSPEAEVNGGAELILYEGGSGRLRLGSQESVISWEIEGDTFSLFLNGNKCEGTVNEGRVTIDFMDTGMAVSFDDVNSTGNETVQVQPDSVFSGSWRGTLTISAASGQWLDYEGREFPLDGEFYYDSDRNIKLSLFTGFFSETVPVITASLVDNGDETALISDGYIFDCLISDVDDMTVSYCSTAIETEESDEDNIESSEETNMPEIVEREVILFSGIYSKANDSFCFAVNLER